MSNQKIKVALIGCGAISSFHCEAIKSFDFAQIIGVYDKNTDRAKEFAKERGFAAFESMEELLASDADLVTVCTPSGLHAKFTIECLEAGKNVVVEKPIAITEADCERILEAEKKTGKFCAPISQLRFYDDIRKAKKIIEDGALGKPVLCDLYMKYYRDPSYYAGSWKGTRAMDGGGALMNQGIHGIDVLRFIVGDIESINGTVRTQVHDIEVEDTAIANVVFKNGAIGVIEGTTSVRPGYPRRLEIHCEKGSMILEESKIIALDMPDFESKEDENKFNSSSDPMNISTEGHRRQYENIFNTMLEKDTLFYTAEQASAAVRTILAIYKSSDEKRNIIL